MADANLSRKCCRNLRCEALGISDPRCAVGATSRCASENTSVNCNVHDNKADGWGPPGWLRRLLVDSVRLLPANISSVSERVYEPGGVFHVRHNSLREIRLPFLSRSGYAVRTAGNSELMSTPLRLTSENSRSAKGEKHLAQHRRRTRCGRRAQTFDDPGRGSRHGLPALVRCRLALQAVHPGVRSSKWSTSVPSLRGAQGAGR